MEEQLKEFIRRLKESGYKLTPQRVEVIRALLSLDHPTAEEIFEEVKKKFPMISLATVYNTLNVLTKLDLVRRIEVGQVTRFDGRLEPHVHVICINRGKIMDLPAEKICDLNEIKRKVSELVKGEVKHVRVDIYIVCSNCEQ